MIAMLLPKKLSLFYKWKNNVQDKENLLISLLNSIQQVDLETL